MNKLRGQLGVVEMMILFIMFIVALALLPTIGQQTDVALGNTTLFPTNGVTSTVGKLVPFLFIIIIIMSGLLLLNPNRPQQMG
jgi:uncharacterized BrkB/YihY/UPF0761 family membrane protein